MSHAGALPCCSGIISGPSAGNEISPTHASHSKDIRVVLTRYNIQCGKCPMWVPCCSGIISGPSAGNEISPVTQPRAS
eukprot:scaffold35295_cov60-Attheya_sp.AAC.7